MSLWGQLNAHHRQFQGYFRIVGEQYCGVKLLAVLVWGHVVYGYDCLVVL